MATNRIVSIGGDDGKPAASPEEHAAEVHAATEEFFAREPAFDAMEAIADEHDMMEKKYASLDRRLSKVEKGNSLLSGFSSEERLIFMCVAGYIFFAFCLPSLVTIMREVHGWITEGVE